MAIQHVERDTETLIDQKLRNLAWIETPTSRQRNVWKQAVKTAAQKRALGGLRPDYVLYPASGDAPLAVIEAKKQGANIHQALRQALDYANRLRAPIVFATDGVFTKTLHLQENKPLFLNDEEVDDLIRESLVLRYQETNAVHTLDKKVVKSRHELISIFSKVNDILREEGLQQGLERFNEFSNILFLKVLSELETIKDESGEASSVKIAHRWVTFHSMKGDPLLSYVNDTVLKHFNHQYEDEHLFRSLSIQHPRSLEAIIALLDDLQLSDTHADIKGDAFEYFIRFYSASNPSDLGEIFTPRHIVKTMVKLLNPRIGETIYDPFCGTGGMLIVAFKHIMDSMVPTPEHIKRLRQKSIYGNELTRTASIAKMNMILAGDGHNNIMQRDSFEHAVDGKYDLVITNYPFAQRTRYGTRYPVKSKNGDLVSPQHCLKALKPGGRMAFIAPEGLLVNSFREHQQVRQYLLEHANLERIVSLPAGAFQPYNITKTNILYFTECNTQKTRGHYWYFNVKNDGYTLDKKRTKIEGENDLDLVLSEKSLENQTDEYLDTIGVIRVEVESVKGNRYVFSGMQYSKIILQTKAHLVKLADLEREGSLILKKGKSITKNTATRGTIPVIAGGQSSPYTHSESNYDGDVITISASGAYSGYVWYHSGPIYASDCTVLRSRSGKIRMKYVYYFLKFKQNDIYKLQRGSAQPHVYPDDLRGIFIPLPSLDEQQAIIEELDSYQAISSYAGKIVQEYKPRLTIGERWGKAKLGEISKVQSGGTPSTAISKYWSGGINWATIEDVKEKYLYSTKRTISDGGLKNSSAKLLPVGTVLFSSRATIGEVCIAKSETCTNQGFKNFICARSRILPEFLYYTLLRERGEIQKLATGTTYPEISAKKLKEYQIPLPSLEEQEAIVTELEEERQLIEANRELIRRMEKKMQDQLASLWAARRQPAGSDSADT